MNDGDARYMHAEVRRDEAAPIVRSHTATRSCTRWCVHGSAHPIRCSVLRVQREPEQVMLSGSEGLVDSTSPHLVHLQQYHRIELPPWRKIGLNYGSEGDVRLQVRLDTPVIRNYLRLLD